MSNQTQVQVFDLSRQRTRLRVSGADRVGFLHGQCTNDIKRRRPGDHCYAAFLNAKGKLRGDADILCRADDFVISCPPDLPASLEKFIITEDVALEPFGGEGAEFLVWGAGPPAGELVFANRLGGWTVFGGAPAGVALSDAEFEARRVAAGVPWWGVDMDATTIPVEAGLAGWAINYDKGCYIGQETIARIKTYGHVNRRLVQLRLESTAARGATIFDVERVVGAVTSIAGRLALGYVRRELAKPGAVVTVDGIQAEVTKLCGDSSQP